MGMFARWDVVPPSVSFIDTQSILSGTPGTMSFSVPATSGNSWAVVCMHYPGTSFRAISSIGGVAPTLIIQTNNSNVRASIWIAKMPAGMTTINVPSTSVATEAYSLYIVEGLLNGGAADDTSVTSGGGSTLGSLTISPFGVVICAAFGLRASGSVGTFTWSGGVTRDSTVNATIPGGNGVGWSSASVRQLSATTLTPSFSISGGGGVIGCGAVFH